MCDVACKLLSDVHSFYEKQAVVSARQQLGCPMTSIPRRRKRALCARMIFRVASSAGLTSLALAAALITTLSHAGGAVAVRSHATSRPCFRCGNNTRSKITKLSPCTTQTSGLTLDILSILPPSPCRSPRPHRFALAHGHGPRCRARNGLPDRQQLLHPTLLPRYVTRCDPGRSDGNSSCRLRTIVWRMSRP